MSNLVEKSKKQIHVLYVEDNPSDAILMIEAFEECAFNHIIDHVSDGQQAIDYILNKAPYELKAKPDLVLLDINLPKKSGFDVLELIKSRDNSKSIPVLMLSSSQSERDILKSYGLNANSYIIKPMDIEKILDTVKAIDLFWINCASLPPSALKHH